MSGGEVKEEFILPNWPRWRFINAWTRYQEMDLRSFCLFSAWWSKQFIGVMFLNFALEYNCKANVKR